MKLRGITEDPPRSGRYRIRYRDQNGADRREWFTTLEEAQQALARRLDQVADGSFRSEMVGRWSSSKQQARRAAQAYSMADVIDEVLAEARATLRSSKTYEVIGLAWKRELGSRTVQEVTVEDVLRYRRRRLKQGASNATCNRYTSFLRRVFYHAVACGYLTRNPLQATKYSGFRDLPEENRQEQVLTVEQQTALRQVMAPRDFAIVCLAIETGMRAGNLFGCRREWVDIDRGLIRIPGSQFKTKRVMTVRLNSVAVEIVRWLLEYADDSEWLLPSVRRRGAHIMPAKWVTNHWKPALKVAGIPFLRFHDLRGTMVTRRLEAGATLEEVRQQGGWTNYTMVQRYARVIDTHRDEVAERAAAASRTLLFGARQVGSDGGSDKLVPLRKRTVAGDR